MKTSECITEIAKAISLMQGSMDPAKKDKVNPFFKSQYADLASIWQAIRQPLIENGLSVIQDAITSEGGLSVVTRILHSSGQWIEFGPLVVPIAKNDPQAMGSAISYGKRYAIGSALGVVAENDDDGQRAQRAAQKEPVKDMTPLTRKQFEVLSELIEPMTEYKTNVLEFLKKSEGVDMLEQMPARLYEKALAGAKAKREAYDKEQAKLIEAEMADVGGENE